MPKLVKAIVLDSDATVHTRAVYALSCLTRQFPAAQVKLIEEGGLESLRGIIDDEKTYDLKTKVPFIIHNVDYNLFGQFLNAKFFIADESHYFN